MASGEIHITFEDGKPVVQRLAGKFPREAKPHLRELLGMADDVEEDESQDPSDDHDDEVEEISSSPEKPKRKRKKNRFGETDANKPGEVLWGSPPILDEDAGKAGEAVEESGPQRIVPAQMHGHPGVVQNVSGATSLNKYGDEPVTHVKNPGNAEPVMNILVRDADKEIDSRRPPQKEEMIFDETITRDEMATLGKIKREIYEAAKNYDMKKLKKLKNLYLKLKDKIIDNLNVEDVEDAEDMADEAAQQKVAEEQGMADENATDMEGMTEKEKENSPVTHEDFVRILTDELKRRNALDQVPSLAKSIGSNLSKSLRGAFSQRLMFQIFSSDSGGYQKFLSVMQGGSIYKATGGRQGGGTRKLASHVSGLSGKAPHVDVTPRRGGPGSPPLGGKYLWRWWAGDHWRYKYADNPSENHASTTPQEGEEDAPGIGGVATPAMVQGYDLQHRGYAATDEDGNKIPNKFSDREGAHEPAHTVKHSLDVHPDLAEHVFDEKGHPKNISEAISSADKAMKNAEDEEEKDRHKSVKDVLEKMQKMNAKKERERHHPETGEKVKADPEHIHADHLYEASIKLYDKTHPESLYWIERHPDGVHLFKQSSRGKGSTLLEPDDKIKHWHLAPEDVEHLEDVIQEDHNVMAVLVPDLPANEDEAKEIKDADKEFLYYLARTKDEKGNDLAFSSKQVYQMNENGELEESHYLPGDTKKELKRHLSDLDNLKDEEEQDKVLSKIEEFLGDKDIPVESIDKILDLSKEYVSSDKERDKEKAFKALDHEVAKILDNPKTTDHDMHLSQYKDFHVSNFGSEPYVDEKTGEVVEGRNPSEYFYDDEGNPIMRLVHKPHISPEKRTREVFDPDTGKYKKEEYEVKKEWHLEPVGRRGKYSRLQVSPSDITRGRGGKEIYKDFASKKQANKAIAWHFLQHRVEQARKKGYVDDRGNVWIKPFESFANQQLYEAYPAGKKKGRKFWYRSPDPEVGERFVSKYPEGSVLHNIDAGKIMYRYEEPYKGTPSEEERYDPQTPGWDVYHQKPAAKLVPHITYSDMQKMLNPETVEGKELLTMVTAAYERLRKYHPPSGEMEDSELLSALYPHIIELFTVKHIPSQAGSTFSGFVPGVEDPARADDPESKMIFRGGTLAGYLPQALANKFRPTGLLYRLILHNGKAGKEAYRDFLSDLATPEGRLNLYRIASSAPRSEEESETERAERLRAKRSLEGGFNPEQEFVSDFYSTWGGMDPLEMDPEEREAFESGLDRVTEEAKKLGPDEFSEAVGSAYVRRSGRGVGFQDIVTTPEYKFPSDETLSSDDRKIKEAVDKGVKSAFENKKISDREKRMYLLLNNMFFHQKPQESGVLDKRTNLYEKIPVHRIRSTLGFSRELPVEDFIPLSVMALNYPEIDDRGAQGKKLEDIRGKYNKFRNSIKRKLMKKAIDMPGYREAEKRLAYQVERLQKAVSEGEISSYDLERNPSYLEAVKTLMSIKKSRMFSHAVERIADGNPVKEEALYYMTELINGNLTKSTGKTSEELLDMMTRDIADAVKGLTGQEVDQDMAKALLDRWYGELKSTELFKGAVYMTLAVEENDMDVLGRLAKDHFQKALSQTS